MGDDVKSLRAARVAGTEERILAAARRLFLRNELGAFLAPAVLGSPAEHALISLLALNGLRVSESRRR